MNAQGNRLLRGFLRNDDKAVEYTLQEADSILDGVRLAPQAAELRLYIAAVIARANFNLNRFSEQG